MEMKKLGFGAMRLPLLDPDDQKSIDIPQFERMADLYMERGFCYFDTAYPYHEEKSEEAVREAVVKRFPRDRFLLADKMPTMRVHSAEDYPVLFKEQLRRCGVEYFDYYLLHNLGRDRYVDTEKYGGFAFMEKLKKEGLAGRIGFSYHDGPDTLDRILTDHPEVDFVQLQINYLDWDGAVAQSGRCYETAVRHGKDVIVMEPVKGGTLARLPEAAMQCFNTYYGTLSVAGASPASGTSGADGASPASGTSGADGASSAPGTSGADGASPAPGMSGADGASSAPGTSGADGASSAPGTSGAAGASPAAELPSPASLAIRYAASLEHVKMVLSGMSDLDQLRDNTSFMEDFRPLTDGERALVDDITRILKSTIKVSCTGCRYCTEVCPVNINIPDYFGLLNLYAVTGKKTGMYYSRFSLDHGKASECLHCGLCEGNCPQHIEIRRFLEEFRGLYE